MTSIILAIYFLLCLFIFYVFIVVDKDGYRPRRYWISPENLRVFLRDSRLLSFALNYGQLQKVWTHY